jgi:hypothetical protein
MEYWHDDPASGASGIALHPGNRSRMKSGQSRAEIGIARGNFVETSHHVDENTETVIRNRPDCAPNKARTNRRFDPTNRPPNTWRGAALENRGAVFLTPALRCVKMVADLKTIQSSTEVSFDG